MAKIYMDKLACVACIFDAQCIGLYAVSNTSNSSFDQQLLAQPRELISFYSEQQTTPMDSLHRMSYS